MDLKRSEGRVPRRPRRLTTESRYFRFMHHKKQLSGAALRRGVHPRTGRDFAFVATIPAADGITLWVARSTCALTRPMPRRASSR
jgi:hypothetical protein